MTDTKQRRDGDASPSRLRSSESAAQEVTSSSTTAKALSSPPLQGNMASLNGKRKREDKDDDSQADQPRLKKASGAAKPSENVYSERRRSTPSSSKGRANGLASKRKHKRTSFTDGVQDMTYLRASSLPQQPAANNYSVFESLLHNSSSGVAEESSNGSGLRKRKLDHSESDGASERPKKAARTHVNEHLASPRDTPAPECLIYKLPVEVALHVFSLVGDTEVTAIRRVSHWFHRNMSDRFAEFCIQKFQGQRDGDKTYHLYFTPEDLQKLKMVVKIPRVGLHFTDLTIMIARRNDYTNSMWDKLWAKYQIAKPEEHEQVLSRFATFNKTVKPAGQEAGTEPSTMLARKLEDSERVLEQQNDFYGDGGKWEKVMAEAFQDLKNLKNIRVCGRDTGVADVVPGRSDGFDPWDTSFHKVPKFATACFSRVVAATISAIAQAHVRLDSLEMGKQPAGCHGAPFPGVMPYDLAPGKFETGLRDSLASLRSLDLTFTPWGHAQSDVDAYNKHALEALGRFFPATSMPSLEHFALSSNTRVRGFDAFDIALDKLYGPRLRRFRLKKMVVHESGLASFLRKHKETLHSVILTDVTLDEGKWANVFKAMRDEVKPQIVALGCLYEATAGAHEAGCIPPSELRGVRWGRKEMLEAYVGSHPENKYADRRSEKNVDKGLDALVRLHRVVDFD